MKKYKDYLLEQQNESEGTGSAKKVLIVQETEGEQDVIDDMYNSKYHTCDYCCDCISHGRNSYVYVSKQKKNT